MELIGRIYKPDVAVLPIGDHFTMGPREAAVALELLGVKRCVPCHYGTFPPLIGTPEELRSWPRRRADRDGARRDRRAVRERWLGATGRRVPEIAVEGELELPGRRLWLEPTAPETLKEAHAAGRPVAAHAATPEGVKDALSHPEVACVLVPPERRDLLDLDLTALTYD